MSSAGVGGSPFSCCGLMCVTVPWGIAVDTAGDVYVTEHDNNQVVKLPAGSNTPIVHDCSSASSPSSETAWESRSTFPVARSAAKR